MLRKPRVRDEMPLRDHSANENQMGVGLIISH
jgi:hypothetical protein